MATTQTPRQQLIQQIRIRLGGNIIDIELEIEEYSFAIDVALDRYRQRSGNSYLESFVFMDVQPDVSEYIMPEDIQEVAMIYRKGIGGNTGGAQIDPFALAYTSSVYFLNNPNGLGAGGAGALATYDLAMQYQSLAGRMFGRDVMFTFDSATHKLFLHRRFTAQEQIAIQCYMKRPEDVLLGDVYAKPWIRDYSVAMCKMIIAEARGKFATLAGPQGGTTLNAETLLSTAKEEMERLEEELKSLVEQSVGYGISIG